MDFICLEALRRKDSDENNGNRNFDFQIYFEIDDERENMKIIDIMRRFFSNYKFSILKSNPYKELCVFLPNMKKSNALEFSNSLKRRMKNFNKEKKEKEFKAIKVRQLQLKPIKPERFVALTGFKGLEKFGIFDKDLNLLFEVERSKYMIASFKKLIGDFTDGIS